MIKNKIPSVIDLFSGCGGLALGFLETGFNIAGGADINPSALETAGYNLHSRHEKKTGYITGDLTELSANDIPIHQSNAGYIVVGGPPCQAYSRAGRGKLRSLGTDRHHLNDPRGNLYEEFIRLALEFDAKAVVMENVPDSVNYGGINIPERICKIFEKKGYSSGWSILNAADYGVPQIRERMILIAIKKGHCDCISFPETTHQATSERQPRWSSKLTASEDAPHFISSSASLTCKKPWVTAGEALSDLPVLFGAAESEYTLYQPNVSKSYRSGPRNDFQRMMREWCRENPGNYVTGHSFRKTLRDFPIFERMKPGDDFREVVKIAEQMFDDALARTGITEFACPERYALLKKKIVPPYSRDKFHEKWKRLDPESPAHTLVAHLGVDTYSHIHPWEPRGISVREAARLQSFPDEYLFQCSMSDAFSQIGNAVPPLLARAVAGHIYKILNGEINL